MSDLNWCPVCDKAIYADSGSLYCSTECLQYDAIHNNPLLGYKFEEFESFLVTHEKRCKQQQCLWRTTFAPANRDKTTSFLHPHDSACLLLHNNEKVTEHRAAPAR